MNWGYIVLAYLSLFVLGLGDNIRGPLFPEILKSFNVTDTAGSVYFAMSSFLGFFGSYSVRFLILKFHRIHTLQFALFLMSLGLAGMGLVTTFPWMLVSAAVFGFSLGVIGVVQNVLVTLGSMPENRQRMLSGLHAFYGISSFLAPLFAAGITSWSGSWRFVFLAVAVLPLLLMLAAFLRTDNDPALPVANDLQVSLPLKSTEHFAHIYLGFGLAFYVLVEIMISSRLALYVRREMGLGLQESSYYLTGFFVGMLLGRILFAMVPFRWPLRRMLSISLILSASCMVLALTLAPWFFVLCGLTMAPFYPLAVAYIYQKFENRIDAALSSCMAIQALLTVVMHASVGYLTDLYGITSALWMGPLGLFFSFLILNSFETLFRKRG